MATTKLYTVEDVEQMPDDARVELLHGELLTKGETSFDHGTYASTVAFRLGLHLMHAPDSVVCAVKASYVLRRDPDVLLMPDVSCVRAERLPPRGHRPAFLPLAPDLAVEVLSPSQTVSELQVKAAQYLAAGSSLVWIVEPDRRSVTVWTPDLHARILTEDDELDGGDLLPGFRLPVTDIFR